MLLLIIPPLAAEQCSYLTSFERSRCVRRSGMVVYVVVKKIKVVVTQATLVFVILHAVGGG